MSETDAQHHFCSASVCPKARARAGAREEDGCAREWEDARADGVLGQHCDGVSVRESQPGLF